MPSYGVEAVRYKGRVGSRLTVLHVVFSIPRCLSPRQNHSSTLSKCNACSLISTTADFKRPLRRRRFALRKAFVAFRTSIAKAKLHHPIGILVYVKFVSQPTELDCTSLSRPVSKDRLGVVTFQWRYRSSLNRDCQSVLHEQAPLLSTILLWPCLLLWLCTGHQIICECCYTES